MKHRFIAVAAFAALLTLVAGTAHLYAMPLIGDPAPEFKAPTTQGDIDFPTQYKGKWVVLFSHPADFTPVCTTEFMTFAKMYPKFQERNCELLGLAVDGVASHIAWLRTITDKIEYKGMKNIVVTFPVIADPMGRVAMLYGMLQPNADSTKAVRAVFFIDPSGNVRALIYYPLSNGRNIDEILRILIAMQTTDAEKVATPADWRPGEDVIVPAPGTCGAASARVAEAAQAGMRCLDWFLCFKPLTPKQPEQTHAK